jgi:hypothetical protein
MIINAGVGKQRKLMFGQKAVFGVKDANHLQKFRQTLCVHQLTIFVILKKAEYIN